MSSFNPHSTFNPSDVDSDDEPMLVIAESEDEALPAEADQQPPEPLQSIPMAITEQEEWTEETLATGVVVPDAHTGPGPLALKASLARLEQMINPAQSKVASATLKPRDYQRQAFCAFLERALQQREHVLSLPMGLGKTFIFVTIAQHFNRILVVTPQTRLGKQAQQGFQQHVGGAFLPISMVAQLKLHQLGQALKQSGIFIATYQLLARNTDDEESEDKEISKAQLLITAITAHTFDLIIFDEAHHLTNRESLIKSCRSEGCRGQIVYVTATPKERIGGEGKSLYDALKLTPQTHSLVDLDLVTAIEQGYLAPVQIIDAGFELVSAQARQNLDTCTTEEQFQHRLRSCLLKPKVMYGYLKLLTQPLDGGKSSLHGRKILVVCNSISQAETLSQFLNNIMMPLVNTDPVLRHAKRLGGPAYQYAVAVYSGMKEQNPQTAMEGFEQGRYSVMIAVNMCSEGVNIPSITGMIGPITSSEVRMMQTFGRGLRLDPSQPNKDLLFVNLLITNKSALHVRSITHGAMTLGLIPATGPVPASPSFDEETQKKLKRARGCAVTYTSSKPNQVFDLGTVGGISARLKARLEEENLQTASASGELSADAAGAIQEDIQALLSYLVEGVKKIHLALSDHFTHIKKTAKRKRPLQDQAGPDQEDKMAMSLEETEFEETVNSLEASILAPARASAESRILEFLNEQFSRAQKTLSKTLKELKASARSEDDEDANGEDTAEPVKVQAGVFEGSQARAVTTPASLKTPAEIKRLLKQMLQDVDRLKHRAVSGSGSAPKGFTLSMHSNLVEGGLGHVAGASLSDMVAAIERMTRELHERPAQEIINDFLRAAEEARAEQARKLEQDRLILEAQRVAVAEQARLAPQAWMVPGKAPEEKAHLALEAEKAAESEQLPEESKQEKSFRTEEEKFLTEEGKFFFRSLFAGEKGVQLLADKIKTGALPESVIYMDALKKAASIKQCSILELMIYMEKSDKKKSFYVFPEIPPAFKYFLQALIAQKYYDLLTQLILNFLLDDRSALIVVKNVSFLQLLIDFLKIEEMQLAKKITIEILKKNPEKCLSSILKMILRHPERATQDIVVRYDLVNLLFEQNPGLVAGLTTSFLNDIPRKNTHSIFSVLLSTSEQGARMLLDWFTKNPNLARTITSSELLLSPSLGRWDSSFCSLQSNQSAIKLLRLICKNNARVCSDLRNPSFLSQMGVSSEHVAKMWEIMDDIDNSRGIMTVAAPHEAPAEQDGASARLAPSQISMPFFHHDQAAQLPSALSSAPRVSPQQTATVFHELDNMIAVQADQDSPDIS